MKKLYFLILMLLVGASTVFAQRYINLELRTNETPGKSYVGESGNTRIDTMMVKITNNGPDTISSSDTVFLYSRFVRKRFYWTLPNGLMPGSSIDTYYHFQLTDEGYSESQTLTNYNWCDSIYLIVPTGTAAATDTNSANDLSCHTVNLSIFVTSVEDIGSNKGYFSIYPNPASDEMKIRYDFGLSSDAKITIRDVAGKAVYVRSLDKNLSGKQEISIDTRLLVGGVYFLEVDADNRKRFSKFTVQR